MSFVSEGERGDLALALALAPSKKHVAVCERGEHAQVSLYHVASQRRQKTLSCSDVASRDYVSAAFSPDSKLLAALSGAPDYTLVLWLWDKGKVLATVKLGQPAARVSFSPNDAKTVATSGTRLLRLWRVAEGAFKPFNLSMGKHKNELHAWNDHTWLADDKLVAVTEASAQIRRAFPSARNSLSPRNSPAARKFPFGAQSSDAARPARALPGGRSVRVRGRHRYPHTPAPTPRTSPPRHVASARAARLPSRCASTACINAPPRRRHILAKRASSPPIGIRAPPLPSLTLIWSCSIGRG